MHRNTWKVVVKIWRSQLKEFHIGENNYLYVVQKWYTQNIGIRNVGSTEIEKDELGKHQPKARLFSYVTSQNKVWTFLIIT